MQWRLASRSKVLLHSFGALAIGVFAVVATANGAEPAVEQADPAPTPPVGLNRSQPTEQAPRTQIVRERCPPNEAYPYTLPPPGERDNPRDPHSESLHSWLFYLYAGEYEMQDKIPYPRGYYGNYYFRPWKPDWVYPLPPPPVRGVPEEGWEMEARRSGASNSGGTLRR